MVSAFGLCWSVSLVADDGGKMQVMVMFVCCLCFPGNSVRGVKFSQLLTEMYSFHIFDTVNNILFIKYGATFFYLLKTKKTLIV